MEASSTPTICRLPDSRRHQLWAIARGYLPWKYIYSRHGRPRWYNIGRADIGLAKARAEAAKLLVLVNDGKDPAADRKAERTSGTFGELAILYRDHAKKKNKSWAQADALVARHLLPRWSKLRPADIARSDVKAMMAKIDAPNPAVDRVPVRRSDGE